MHGPDPKGKKWITEDAGNISGEHKFVRQFWESAYRCLQKTKIKITKDLVIHDFEILTPNLKKKEKRYRYLC